MLLSELKNIKFDLFDYPESGERQAISEKLASDGGALLSRDDVKLLSDSDFAVVIKEGRQKLRKYPMCDVKTASISKLFLQAHKDDMPECVYKLAEHNLSAFEANKAITNNTITTKEIYAMEKEAGVKEALDKREKLADSDFALVIDNSGIKTRLYPIDSEPNCKLASEYFSEKLETIPVHLRHEFAKAIVVKCASAGFSSEIITPDIRSYCNNRLNPNFEFEVNSRKQKIASEKVKSALDTLVELSTTENLQKIANVLYRLDKELSLDKYYGKNFSDPYRAVFDNTGPSQEKAANVSIVGEYSVDPQQLSQMPYEGQMQNLFSQDDFNAITQDPAAYEALPDMYKKAIQQQLPGKA